MKKLLCILAAWFLLDWAFYSKIKPFICREFGLACSQQQPDSTCSCNDSIPGTGNFIYGIDISHHQNNEVDWLKTKQGQYQFVICKATEGITMKDGDFKNNWSVLTAKNIIKGAYHFYRCADAPERQADSFVSFAGNFSATDLPPILDFETENIFLKNGTQLTNCIGTDTNATRQNLLKFLQRVEQLTKRIPIIYVNTYDGERFFTDTTFAVYPLWIATRNISTLTNKHIPSIWKGNWTFWQKSQVYDFDNNSANDLDVFNGDMGALTAFISTTIIKP
ncbi:MAG: hypothetical protein IPP72_16925 [Chitinophagaceae bacterium]|nr:hypothetical protein [Chitinophagaceae bacterium]